MSAATETVVKVSDRVLCRAKLLTDRNRIAALKALARGELTVNELCAAIGQPQPTVSNTLGMLKMAGAVESTTRGKFRVYTLAPLGVRLIEALAMIEQA